MVYIFFDSKYIHFLVSEGNKVGLLESVIEFY